ncbi:hypothetical protein [Ureibacillus chungkukjangi]|uniref:Uncharacterized protein n=2 Tax=Ureibacillus chungkukjangi TaxID=1202712 RepID=A0A318TTG1_9BACL|nr:hypothetical protein [Ureibacillus chungkukjangi]PYF07130.1 hypothetical protein BJ095_106145 [Ureibacillus chungkukjangi]
MYGSMFYNFWAAIIGFSIYFFSTLSGTSLPFNNILGSLIAAAVAFVGMFAFRFLLGYILYMPGDELFKGLDKENERMREQLANNESDTADSGVNNSTMEFKDQSSEEIAKVVQSMLQEEESVKS